MWENVDWYFQFQDDFNYNSIECIEQKQYLISTEEITKSEGTEVFNKTIIIPELLEVPFPQADKFERVVDLLTLLAEKDYSKEELTNNFQFNSRQTQYYTDAGRYIGLVDKYLNAETKEVMFCLTNEGKNLLKRSHKAKILDLMQKILQQPVFNKVFQLSIEKGAIPEKNIICEIMRQSQLNITGSTVERRASTVRGWIEWIWEQID